MDDGDDAYCCICGGPLQVPSWLPRQRTEGRRPRHSYDPSIILPNSPALHWLNDVRLIGEHSEGPGSYANYISGHAHMVHGAVFDAESGDDENFPDGDGRFTAYSWGMEYPLIFPFHQPCYRLLCAAAEVKELDKDTLYATLTDLYHPEGNAKMLSVDYGVVEALQGSFWEVEYGTEHVVFSPLEIPELATYYENLPTLKTEGTFMSLTKDATTTADPLSRLAPEIRLAILDYLDIPSILNFGAASKSTLNLQPGNFFWRNRLMHDMPWLYDIPKLSDAKERSALDWKQIYKDLYMASREGGVGRILGLVNRRRIWELPVSDIVECYLTKYEEENEEADSGAAEDEG